jgi:hypothetical protein
MPTNEGRQTEPRASPAWRRRDRSRLTQADRLRRVVEYRRMLERARRDAARLYARPSTR